MPGELQWLNDVQSSELLSSVAPLGSPDDDGVARSQEENSQKGRRCEGGKPLVCRADDCAFAGEQRDLLNGNGELV